jgi:cytochrome c
LIKIEFNKGNRKPNVTALADKTSGAVPLAVKFSSEGTNYYDEYDQGKLTFEWKISNGAGLDQTLTEANPSFTFAEAGTYQVTLTVTDTKGEKNSASIEVVAGNEPPVVSIDFSGMNKTFYFGEKELNYSITVSDKEDGSSADGKIKAEEVAVTFDYVPAGFDPIEIASKQSGAESVAILNLGKNLIEGSDCKSCHQYDKTSIGPSYEAVATKYPNSEENTKYLVGKIINGGAGVWGDHAMSAHPQLSEADAKRMVDYILSMDEVQATVASLPLSGKVNPTVPEGENGQGSFLLRASYADKGAGAIGPLSGVDYIALRNPFLNPQLSVDRKGVQLLTTPSVNFLMAGDNSHFALKEIDLTGIQQIDVLSTINQRNGGIGGSVEIRLGSPTGELLGQSEKIGRKEGGGFRPPQGVNPIEWRRQNANRAKVKIKPTTGMQDVYFVFKNPEAKGDQVLMSILEIEFKNVPTD